MTDKKERQKAFYKKGYDYMSKMPYYIDAEDLILEDTPPNDSEMK